MKSVFTQKSELMDERDIKKKVVGEPELDRNLKNTHKKGEI